MSMEMRIKCAYNLWGLDRKQINSRMQGQVIVVISLETEYNDKRRLRARKEEAICQEQ
jgi:hypothetical protein